MNRRKNALAWERQEKLQIEAFEAKRRLASLKSAWSTVRTIEGKSVKPRISHLNWRQREPRDFKIGNSSHAM